MTTFTPRYYPDFQRKIKSVAATLVDVAEGRVQMLAHHDGAWLPVTLTPVTAADVESNGEVEPDLTTDDFWLSTDGGRHAVSVTPRDVWTGLGVAYRLLPAKA